MIATGVSWCFRWFVFPLPEACTKTVSRIIFSAMTSLIITLVLGSTFIKWLQTKKVGQPIREGEGFLLAELHKQKKDTPTMGGALIIVAVLISAIMWGDWSSVFPWLMVGSLLVFGAIGVVDDWAKLKSKSSKGLSGRLRLGIQSLFALLVMFVLASPCGTAILGLKTPLLQSSGVSVPFDQWLSCVSIPFQAEPVFMACGLSWLLIWFLQWLTLVGTANAVNLTDGLDGLAAGCSIFAIIPLMVFAIMSNHQELASIHSTVFIQGSGEVAVCLAALCGACLGFLWFNSFPAQVFMGDTGSLAIGGMMGAAAVCLHREWLLAMVGAVFVVETVSVIMQVFSFKHSGKRIFRCTPLHHHFEYGGVHEAKVVVRFWIVGALLAILGLISILV